jgi:hypothetical protein
MAKPVHVAINFDKGEIPFKKYGDIANIKVDFLCVAPIGTYREPLRAHVEDQIDHLIQWTNQVGFPKTRCIKYEELAKTGGALSLYLAPKIPAKSGKMRTFGKYCMWLLLMDDIMDERTSQQPPTTTYGALLADVKVLVGILNGDYKADNAPAQVSNMSHFKTLCKVVQEVNEQFTEHLPAFADRENRQHLIKRTLEFLHAFLWRFGRVDPQNSSESTYLHFRRHHSASYCIFESVALLHDFDWVNFDIDRDDVEFVNWIQSYTHSLSISNDVLSLRKEMTDDETENLAIHRYMNQSMDINDAITSVCQFTNAETHEMKEYGKRLMHHHPNSRKMEDLVEMSNWTLDGHLYWYGFSQRYGKMALKERHLTEAEYQAIRLKHARETPADLSVSGLVKIY